MKIEMKKRIEQVLQNTVPSKIQKLELAGDCRAQQLEGLTDEFENLKHLTLSNIGLTTLKGFPKLTNLKQLNIGDNCLNGGLENLAQCVNLTRLDLKGNKIQCIEQLEPLACLKNLKFLELENCEIAKTDGYRKKIFAILPSVKWIDGLDANGEECDEEEDFEGEGEEGEENEGSLDGDENDDDDDDDDDDDEEGDDDDEDDDASETNEVGLSYLQKTDLGEDEDDEDFDAEKAMQQNNTTAEEEEDEIDEEEVKAISEGVEIVNEDSNSRSCRKRKHEEENSNQ